MGFDPIDPDTLSERTGFAAALLSTHLLTMELDGLIERLSSGAYRRLG